MNLTKVTLPGRCSRYCGSMAEGREYRLAFMEEFQVPKKAVLVEPATVPTNKLDLIAFLNQFLVEIDAHSERA